MSIKRDFNRPILPLGITSERQESIKAQWAILKPLVGERLPARYRDVLDNIDTLDTITPHQKEFLRTAGQRSLAIEALNYLDLGTSFDPRISKDIRKNHMLDTLVMLKDVDKAFNTNRDLLNLTQRVHITILYKNSFNQLLESAPKNLFRHMDIESLKEMSRDELLALKVEPRKERFFGWFSP